MNKFERMETTLKCEIICKMNELIWLTDEDLINTWLMIGPPDGCCQEYEEAQDKESCELWEYVQEKTTFLKWSSVFGSLVTFHYEEDE